MRNFFIKHFGKNYLIEPFIYLDNYGRFSKHMTSKIQWLETFTIRELNENKADITAFAKLNKIYPEYKDYIYIF